LLECKICLSFASLSSKNNRGLDPGLRLDEIQSRSFFVGRLQRKEDFSMRGTFWATWQKIIDRFPRFLSPETSLVEDLWRGDSALDGSFFE